MDTLANTRYRPVYGRATGRLSTSVTRTRLARDGRRRPHGRPRPLLVASAAGASRPRRRVFLRRTAQHLTARPTLADWLAGAAALAAAGAWALASVLSSA